MQNLKYDLESLKADYVKLRNSKSNQEEINELILISLTHQEPHKNNSQNSCSTRKRRKEDTKSCGSEETTDNIQMIFGDLTNYDEMKHNKQKGRSMDLQGEFKKLKPPMFDGESEEVVKAWLLNIKRYFQVYSYDDNLRAHLVIFQLSGKATLWCWEAKSVNNI